MKNKILLTLVLLIPSLCFGESGIIGIFLDDKKETIRLMHISTSTFKETITFRTHKKLLYFKDNKEETLRFLEKFQTLYPDHFSRIAGHYFKDGSDFTALHVMMEEILIKNGYAITHKESNFHSNATIYFLKSDK